MVGASISKFKFLALKNTGKSTSERKLPNIFTARCNTKLSYLKLIA